MKKSLLFTVLLASLTLVGCGGGGHGKSSTGPSVSTPNEVFAAKATVTPIVSNAKNILNYSPTASYRYSSTQNDSLSFSDVSNNLETALKAPEVLISFLRANGSTLTDLSGQFDSHKNLEEVSTFSSETGVYERRVYADVETSRTNPDKYLVYYRIEKCRGVINDDGILSSLTIEDSAPITVDDKERGLFFKGKITTDFKLSSADAIIKSTDVVNNNGEYITSGTGYQPAYKMNISNNYSFSSLSLDLDSIEIKDNFDYEHQSYDGITKGTDVKISISGLDGSIISETKDVFYGGKFVKWNNGNWIEDKDKKTSSKLVVIDHRTNSITYKVPVNISVSGKITNTSTDKKTNSGTVSETYLKVTKLTKDNSKLGCRIDKAEAHVKIDSISTSKNIKVGDKEFPISLAKIVLTNLKYDYSWKSLSHDEKNKNIFGNAIAKVNAEDSKNKILIDARYDIANKSITGTLTNDGTYVYKDEDMLLNFNFSIVKITGTDVKFVDQNNFEDAIFAFEATEKDGTLSTRTYKVKNNKLVLVSSNDKQVIELPEGISNNASDIIDAVDAGILNTSSFNSKIKIGSGDEESILATYNQDASGNDKKIETSLMAKDTVIYAIAYYYDEEKNYTVLFVFNNENSKIKGVIFSGLQSSVTLNTVANRIGTFSGIDSGKITILTEDGTSHTAKVR